MREIKSIMYFYDQDLLFRFASDFHQNQLYQMIYRTFIGQDDSI
jgi:hypothetical protein